MSVQRPCRLRATSEYKMIKFAYRPWFVLAGIATAIATVVWWQFPKADTENANVAQQGLAPLSELPKESSQPVSSPSKSPENRSDKTTKKSEFIPWNELTIHASLADLLKRAASSQKPEEAYIAIQVGVVCLTTQAFDQQKLREVAGVHLQQANQETIAAAAQAMEAARLKLASFCRDYDNSELGEAVSVARKTAFSGRANGPMLSSLVGKPGAQAALTQEQSQAVLLSLGQPEINAIAVDRILASSAIAFTPYKALTGSQRLIAQSLIYWELTGDRSEESLRNLYVCSTTAICVSNPGRFVEAQEYEKAREISKQVVNLVRMQNWQGLGIPR